MRVGPGRYGIGLTREGTDTLMSLRAGTPIRPEFILASLPRHEFQTDGFFMADRPVTCREFREFVELSGYVTLAEAEGWGWVWEGRWRRREGVSWERPFGNGTDALYRSREDVLPVMQVAWRDADAFCRWRASRGGVGTRIPDEREWESFASLAGIPSADGLAVDSSGAASRAVEPEVYVRALLSAVGQGVTAGLLWEWTSSWYDSYPGGGANRDFGTTYRVLRGGSPASFLTQRAREYRLRKCPTARSPYYGFRIAGL